MILANARLLFADRIAASGHVRILDGKIAALSDQPLLGLPDEEIINVGGRFLCPGFIDMHLHGALRRDAMEATPEAFETICRHHALGGTTSLALATVTAPIEDIVAVLLAARAYRSAALSAPPTGAQLLGIHIEGPFFSRQKPGAHRPELLRDPSRALWEPLLAHADVITQMTLAPELPGALELIDALVEAKIRVSGGHSDAWEEDAAAAYAHGMEQVTHTFNCMSSARRRGPYRVAGLLEFALSEPEILCELIADCRHVAPTLMRMLYLAKGPEGVALITDSTAGAGLPEETPFDLAGIACVVRDGVGLTADGKALAGSTSTMIEGVKNLVQTVGIQLTEAVRMATLNPARALGIEAQKGTLSVGADADLVIFNDEFRLSHTFVGGHLLQRAEQA